MYRPLSISEKKLRISKIEKHFTEIMKLLDLDVTDESIKDTPKRVAKMYFNEVFSSLHNKPPKITTFPNKGYDQILVEKNITINSYCEHHFVPFVGTCHIAYLPGSRVIGLSKLIRVAQYFSYKPQLQERLTTEIAEYLIKVLKTEDVAVIINCQHFCCKVRGAKDANSSTVTSYMGGIFRNVAAKAELLKLIDM
jgi:GTP cyclohydrolase I